jgi:hypothetical protein
MVMTEIEIATVGLILCIWGAVGTYQFGKNMPWPHAPGQSGLKVAWIVVIHGPYLWVLAAIVLLCELTDW